MKKRYIVFERPEGSKCWTMAFKEKCWTMAFKDSAHGMITAPAPGSERKDNMKSAFIPLDPVLKTLVRMAFEEGCSSELGSCDSCTFQKADGSDCIFWKESTANRKLMEFEYPADINTEKPDITDKEILDWVDKDALEQMDAVEWRLKHGKDASFRDSVKWHIKHGVE